MASSASRRHLPRKLSVNVREKSRSCGNSESKHMPLRTIGEHRIKGGVRRGETASEHVLIHAVLMELRLMLRLRLENGGLCRRGASTPSPSPPSSSSFRGGGGGGGCKTDLNHLSPAMEIGRISFGYPANQQVHTRIVSVL